MGIRIHKVMGWGLTDVQRDDDGHLADPRINSDSFLLDLDHEQPASLAAYERYARSRKVENDPRTWFLPLSPGLRDSEPADAVVYKFESADDHVLVVRPVGFRNWFRFDDIMDWVEETYLRRDDNDADPLESRVEVLPHGPYPFNGSYMRADTGERLPDTVMPWIRAASSRLTPSVMRDLRAQEAGFVDHDDACNLVVPEVPFDIRVLSDYGDLFTSDDVWLQLRPVLYTFWA